MDFDLNACGRPASGCLQGREPTYAWTTAGGRAGLVLSEHPTNGLTIAIVAEDTAKTAP